jgi:hypothetical protein
MSNPFAGHPPDVDPPDDPIPSPEQIAGERSEVEGATWDSCTEGLDIDCGGDCGCS